MSRALRSLSRVLARASVASRANDSNAVQSSATTSRVRSFTSTSEPAPWWSASPSGRVATVVSAFATKSDRERWTTFGDFEHGGASTCVLVPGDDAEETDESEEGQVDARFIAERFSTIRGTISSEIPGHGGDGPSTTRLRRSGFAGARMLALQPTLFVPDPTLDLDAYDALSYRVRGDGRSYVASVVTENWMTETTSEDAWLATFHPPPNEWVDIVIPIEAFTQTFRGRAMVGEHSRMSASRVVRLAIAVAGSASENLEERRENDGPFRLDVHSIVGLRMTEEEMDAHAASRRGDHTKYPLGGFALLAHTFTHTGSDDDDDDDVF
ncbi:complex I intermediate-associated protein 30-domain-containing protein [Ostreococcus tauri]|uniref:Complex I intermediate-associated protein 30-domain-containing protein n=1 Tax=Ostreococcus tauri TaxID=70448 RepID=A0A1Y5IIE7_OSTTA|nr:complex I intermediate-associated protein 30-domain-containing protein [Ostreococcus tauri]